MVQECNRICREEGVVFKTDALSVNADLGSGPINTISVTCPVTITRQFVKK